MKVPNCMNNICFITDKYPNEADPASYVFVRNIIWELADSGKNVSVISPIHFYTKNLKRIPVKLIEKTFSGNNVFVFFPRYFYIPGVRLHLALLSLINLFFYRSACKKAILNENIQVDCFYGHFIHRAGMCACRLGEIFCKPSFVAYGESSDWTIHNAGGVKHVRQALKNVNGVIAVSTKNKEYLMTNSICDCSKIGLFVNGVQLDKFYPRNKLDARAMFGFDNNTFIIAFVGHFIERKGIIQLSEAAIGIKNTGVIYAGKGELSPTGSNTLFKDFVSPDKMPYFLSAADVFVLPTKNEGCANAILEALACGLPVISSDLPFNYDVLDESCSILVDPNSIDEIRNAILKLKNDKNLREELSQGALEKSKGFSLTKRAENISQFMDARK